MSQYGSVEYWNERYAKDGDCFEWYNQYSSFKDHIAKYVKKEDKILVIGCGDSNLSEDMYRDGYTDITSNDYSSVVINKMKDKCAEKTGMKWDIMDVHHMTYPDASFDAVVDKGTLDAIICGDESTCKPDQVLSEVNRVLKKGGVYICVSFGMPEYRMDYFQAPTLKWKVVHVPLRNSFFFE